MKIEGRAYVLPAQHFDDVNTDVILAGPHLRLPEDQLGLHAFSAILPSFPADARGRPILVGGANFGCGSSREQAPKALLGCGIRLVIASSFGHIFYRNAINLGLAAAVCPTPERLRALDACELHVDLEAGSLRAAGPGGSTSLSCQPLPPHLLRILAGGGILPLLAQTRDAS